MEHILERLISWIEREILGKVKSFKELESLLYAQNKPSEGKLHAPRGITELIESMIPYRYYEVLSADDIKLFKDATEKIYKDAVNEALSMAMDKPSLMQEQVYEESKLPMPEFKQEDILTPWLQGSEYERI
jgi:sugar-specific transcriptional regulator TrmB